MVSNDIKPAASAEAKLKEFLQHLENPSLVSRDILSLYPPTDMVAAVTSEIALEHLLPAVFARGDKYQHLTVGSCPPGCEDIDPGEWNYKFDEELVHASEEEVEVSWDVRIYHSDYSSALSECLDDLYEEKLNSVRLRKREREREWARDNIKGKALNLLQEWLSIYKALDTLESRAADAIAIQLFPSTIKVEEGQNSGLRISTLGELQGLLQRKLGSADYLETSRISVFDALVPYLISWELIQDLWDHHEIARTLKLPGTLEDFERLGESDECWWENKGIDQVLDILPPHERSHISLVVLSTFLNGLAERKDPNEFPCWYISFLIRNCDVRSCLEVKMAMPAIKGMLLRWYMNTADCSEGCPDGLEDFLEDVQKQLGLRITNTKVAPSVLASEENPEIAFSCRCQACSQIIDFLNNVRLPGQLDEDKLEIEVIDPAMRKCLYQSVETQGFGYVSATLCSKDRIRLRRGQESKRQLGRKRRKVEATNKAIYEARDRKYETMLQEHWREFPVGFPASDVEKCLRDCLYLIDDDNSMWERVYLEVDE